MSISVEGCALMANEHIELIKKWLDNPESVSTEELKANAEAAYYAYYAATAPTAYAGFTSSPAKKEAAHNWVKKYEEATNAK